MKGTKEKIELTPVQLNKLFHDTIDLFLRRHGSFSGSKLEEGDEGDLSIELTACSPDDDDLEIVATVYVRGKRLKEIQEGGE